MAGFARRAMSLAFMFCGAGLSFAAPLNYNTTVAEDLAAGDIQEVGKMAAKLNTEARNVSFSPYELYHDAQSFWQAAVRNDTTVVNFHRNMCEDCSELADPRDPNAHRSDPDAVNNFIARNLDLQKVPVPKKEDLDAGIQTGQSYGNDRRIFFDDQRVRRLLGDGQMGAFVYPVAQFAGRTFRDFSSRTPEIILWNPLLRKVAHYLGTRWMIYTPIHEYCHAADSALNPEETIKGEEHAFECEAKALAAMDPKRHDLMRISKYIDVHPEIPNDVREYIAHLWMIRQYAEGPEAVDKFGNHYWAAKFEELVKALGYHNHAEVRQDPMVHSPDEPPQHDHSGLNSSVGP